MGTAIAGRAMRAGAAKRAVKAPRREACIFASFFGCEEPKKLCRVKRGGGGQKGKNYNRVADPGADAPRVFLTRRAVVRSPPPPTPPGPRGSSWGSWPSPPAAAAPTASS